MNESERNTGEGWMNEGDDTARDNERNSQGRDSDADVKASGQRETESGSPDARSASADSLDDSLRARRDENYGEVY
ncbi:MAG: hypothetical protein JWM95_2106 [Gemmatimonadetes bacterium]|nr:hypothetical protein [Gemmatimonadota bacterium]